jgi:hypothetical protein
MNNIYEGHQPARSDAEMKSKKEKKEVFVVKVNSGGLRYVVTEKPEEVEEGKIVDHYKDGNKVK